MNEIKSNYPNIIIDTAIKYIGEPHCISLLTSAMIDEHNPKINIDLYVHNELSVEEYTTHILYILQNYESTKILFRSCFVNGNFVSEFQKIKDLTSNIKAPSSSDEFLYNSKVILDMVVENTKTVFKCYRVNEQQPRTITISIKESEILNLEFIK